MKTLLVKVFTDIYEGIKRAIKSKTVWTMVVIFALNTSNVWLKYLDVDQIVIANATLTALATYFKVKK